MITLVTMLKECFDSSAKRNIVYKCKMFSLTTFTPRFQTEMFSPLKCFLPQCLHSVAKTFLAPNLIKWKCVLLIIENYFSGNFANWGIILSPQELFLWWCIYISIQEGEGCKTWPFVKSGRFFSPNPRNALFIRWSIHYSVRWSVRFSVPCSVPSIFTPSNM